MGLNPGFAGWDLFAHEHMKCPVGAGGIVYTDPEQGASIRVHGGIPQLVGVHLTQPLVALYLHLFGALYTLQCLFFFRLGVNPLLQLGALNAVEGGLGDEEVAVVD